MRVSPKCQFLQLVIGKSHTNAFVAYRHDAKLRCITKRCGKWKLFRSIFKVFFKSCKSSDLRFGTRPILDSRALAQVEGRKRPSDSH